MKIFSRMEPGIGKHMIEDRVLVGDTILAGGNFELTLDGLSRPFSVAVADGVGGNCAGHVAAHMAVEGLVSFRIPENAHESNMKQIVQKINHRIVEESRLDHRYYKMATTLTGVCRVGERWYLFHVGNTRLYSWKRPRLTQLSADHSWAWRMRLSGTDEKTIRESKRATEISSCLGNGDETTADQLVVRDITEEIESAEMLLLTSDGVHEYIRPDTFELSLRSITEVPVYLKQALSFARENGSDDDLSMVIIDLRKGALQI